MGRDRRSPRRRRRAHRSVRRRHGAGRSARGCCALASIGVEPSDGVGALRLLAALVRLLNRNQLIEPDDLRAEIRESLAQGAAAALFQDSNGMEPEASSPDASGPSIETAET